MQNSGLTKIMRSVFFKTLSSVAKTTRFFGLSLLVASLFLCFCIDANAKTRTRAPAPNPRYASLTMDAQTGKILASSNADAVRYPASLTKLMTLFLTFEAMDRGRVHINKPLEVSQNAVRQPPTKLGLRVGQNITIQQAILVLVTRSANDVAVALAETLGGSEKNFAHMMNARAQSLGMTHTHFENPSGLPNPTQRTTARDIAILSRALMQYFPHYYHYFGTRQCSFRGQYIKTHNNLMCRYPGMDGLKTGYIGTSGFNLAASAVRHNRRIIVVVFGGRTAYSRDEHVADLMDQGFAMLEREKQATQIAAVAPPLQPIAVTPANTKTDAIPKYTNVSAPAAPPPQPTLQPTSIVAGALEDAPPPSAPVAQKVAYLPTKGAGANNWGIQVGAYGSQSLGQQALTIARGILKDLPPTATGVVLPAQTPNGLVYRARFLGLSAEHASSACKRLRECMAFAMQ